MQFKQSFDEHCLLLEFHNRSLCNLVKLLWQPEPFPVSSNQFPLIKFNFYWVPVEFLWFGKSFRYIIEPYIWVGTKTTWNFEFSFDQNHHSSPDMSSRPYTRVRPYTRLRSVPGGPCHTPNRKTNDGDVRGWRTSCVVSQQLHHSNQSQHNHYNKYEY